MTTPELPTLAKLAEDERIDVRSLRLANSAGASGPCTFHEDLGPSEYWLSSKRESVLEAGDNAFGVSKHFGPVTGHFSRKLMLPVAMLSDIPGERGEQSAVRTDSLEYIKVHFEKDGLLPGGAPFMTIDPVGRAWINEGNHRIMFAAQTGIEFIPCEVRYFTGSQLCADKGFSPQELLDLDADFQLRAGGNTPMPRWFQKGQPVENIFDRSDDFVYVMETEEAGLEWRECRLPIDALSIDTDHESMHEFLRRSGNLLDSGSQTELRCAEIRTAIEQAGGIEPFLNEFPPLLISDGSQIEIADGWHRIAIGVFQYGLTELPVLCARSAPPPLPACTSTPKP